jgi:hypothetical protein
MRQLMWKHPATGIWHWVKTFPADQAEQTLKWFRDGHPMYEYKLEEVGPKTPPIRATSDVQI